MVASTCVVAVLVVPSSADETLSDLRRDREAARDAEQAALASLDLLAEDDAVIQSSLDEMQLLVDAQAARVEGARQALAAAESEVVAREAGASDAALAIIDTRAEVQVRAIEAYVGTDNSVDPWLESGNVNQTVIRLSMLDFAAGNERDLLDDLRTFRALQEENVRLGEAARQEADRLRVEVEVELNTLEERRFVQLKVQTELHNRIEAEEARAADWAATNDDLTALIKAETVSLTGIAAGSASLEGFIFPTTGKIGSSFGPRVHPIFRTTRQHTGVDVAGATGNAIWAAKDGRVIFAGWKGGYGNTVLLIHGNGSVVTLYAHMSKIRASVGDQIDQGEVIGEVGSTGWSTGPHLHFEVRVNGVPKNPVAFLP